MELMASALTLGTAKVAAISAAHVARLSAGFVFGRGGAVGMVCSRWSALRLRIVRASCINTLTQENDISPKNVSEFDASGARVFLCYAWSRFMFPIIREDRTESWTSPVIDEILLVIRISTEVQSTS